MKKKLDFKLRQIIQFNQFRIPLEKAEWINEQFSEETMELIHSTDWDYGIYVDAFLESMESDDFNQSVNEKLKDSNFYGRKKAFYDRQRSKGR